MKTVTCLLATLLLLVACSGAEEEPATPTPTPTPEEWLSRAVSAWNGMETFHFALSLEERQIELDEQGALSFAEVEGDVQAPDRVQAEATIRTPFGSTPVAFIAIGEEQWLTNPLNGEWEAAPANMRTDVTYMFDPEEGIGAILAGIEGLERLPDETVEEVEAVHLQGHLPGSLLSAFASDLPETVTVDLWMSPQDHHIRRLLITEAETNATWTFLFSDFDSDITIEPPL